MYLHEYDAQVQDAIRNRATKLVIMFTIYNWTTSYTANIGVICDIKYST